jgi:hypothetical protein
MTMKTDTLHYRAILVFAIAALAGCSGSSNRNSFAFKSDSPDRYVRVDRTGQPAIATALLSRDPAIQPVSPTGVLLNPGNAANPFNDQRDALNRGEPANDGRDFAGIMTVGPQANALRNIHYKVGPQLRALGLTPCSTETATPPAGEAQVDIAVCVAQAAPVILPDVITYDLTAAPGWPNGRGFDDPVVDRLLAAALLRISGTGAPHALDALVGVINTTGDETGSLSPAAFPHMRARAP